MEVSQSCRGSSVRMWVLLSAVAYRSDVLGVAGSREGKGLALPRAKDTRARDGNSAEGQPDHSVVCRRSEVPSMRQESFQHTTSLAARTCFANKHQHSGALHLQSYADPVVETGQQLLECGTWSTWL